MPKERRKLTKHGDPQCNNNMYKSQTQDKTVALVRKSTSVLSFNTSTASNPAPLRRKDLKSLTYITNSEVKKSSKLSNTTQKQNEKTNTTTKTKQSSKKNNNQVNTPRTKSAHNLNKDQAQPKVFGPTLQHQYITLHDNKLNFNNTDFRAGDNCIKVNVRPKKLNSLASDPSIILCKPSAKNSFAKKLKNIIVEKSKQLSDTGLIPKRKCLNVGTYSSYSSAVDNEGMKHITLKRHLVLNNNTITKHDMASIKCGRRQYDKLRTARGKIHIPNALLVSANSKKYCPANTLRNFDVDFSINTGKYRNKYRRRRALSIRIGGQENKFKPSDDKHHEKIAISLPMSVDKTLHKTNHLSFQKEIDTQTIIKQTIEQATSDNAEKHFYYIYGHPIKTSKVAQNIKDDGSTKECGIKSLIKFWRDNNAQTLVKETINNQTSYNIMCPRTGIKISSRSKVRSDSQPHTQNSIVGSIYSTCDNQTKECSTNDVTNIWKDNDTQTVSRPTTNDQTSCNTISLKNGIKNMSHNDHQTDKTRKFMITKGIKVNPKYKENVSTSQKLQHAIKETHEGRETEHEEEDLKKYLGIKDSLAINVNRKSKDSISSRNKIATVTSSHKEDEINSIVYQSKDVLPMEHSSKCSFKRLMNEKGNTHKPAAFTDKLKVLFRKIHKLSRRRRGSKSHKVKTWNPDLRKEQKKNIQKYIKIIRQDNSDEDQCISKPKHRNFSNSPKLEWNEDDDVKNSHKGNKKQTEYSFKIVPNCTCNRSHGFFDSVHRIWSTLLGKPQYSVDDSKINGKEKRNREDGPSKKRGIKLKVTIIKDSSTRPSSPFTLTVEDGNNLKLSTSKLLQNGDIIKKLSDKLFDDPIHTKKILSKYQRRKNGYPESTFSEKQKKSKTRLDVSAKPSSAPDVTSKSDGNEEISLKKFRQRSTILTVQEPCSRITHNQDMATANKKSLKNVRDSDNSFISDCLRHIQEKNIKQRKNKLKRKRCRVGLGYESKVDVGTQKPSVWLLHTWLYPKCLSLLGSWRQITRITIPIIVITLGIICLSYYTIVI